MTGRFLFGIYQAWLLLSFAEFVQSNSNNFIVSQYTFSIIHKYTKRLYQHIHKQFKSPDFWSVEQFPHVFGQNVHRINLRHDGCILWRSSWMINFSYTLLNFSCFLASDLLQLHSVYFRENALGEWLISVFGKKLPKNDQYLLTGVCPFLISD